MKYIANRLAAFARQEDGSVAIIFGLAVVVILAAAGIALDFARAAHARTQMQQALDSAVLAGVRAKSDAQLAAAQKIFDNNFINGSAKNVSVSFNPAGELELSGKATGQLDTTLAAVLGVKKMSIGVSSRAKAIGGGIVCILVLDKAASQAFLVNSGPDVDAPECELHVKSTASPAAIFNSGSDIETKRICIAGKNIIDNGGRHPNLEKECITAEDPFAGKLTEPSSGSCTYSNLNFNGGNVTLKPGVYCGWVNFNNNPNVTFSPGTYIIKNGGWNVNGGTWTGKEVTFFFADQSKIQFNSAVSATISAPTFGTYKDIVMFEKSGLSRSQLVFDDSRDMNLKGVMYLPSRDVTFNSGSRLNNKKMTIIVNTLILNGTRWTLEPATDDIMSGTVKTVRLIE